MAPTKTTNGTRHPTSESANGRSGASHGPLTRLNYFDGKFLRAADMRIEQEYLRLLVFTSNIGGGPGIVHGYDATLESGDQIAIGAGLAIDRQGRVLLLPSGASFDIAELIGDSSAPARTTQGNNGAGSQGEHIRKRADHGFEPCGCGDPRHEVEPPTTGDYYLICVAHRERRCGQEDVYGHLCGDACATATDQPYLREDVAVRAVPLALTELLPDSRAVPFSRVHLQSRVASALFRQEVRNAAGSLISKAGLGQEAWCLGAALSGEDCVPLAVLARSGGTNVFLDAWPVRRERIEPPAKRYWAWRMRMRPWDAFLAHVLQFQCQLAGLAVAQPRPGELEDPYGPHVDAIDEAHGLVQEIREFYRVRLEERDTDTTRSDHPLALAGGMTRLDDVGRKLGGILKGVYGAPRDRVLLDGGIVELPSAGYLPVDNASSASVNDQVRRLLGGGLDLRFCVVRPDFVAHALEAAQHMERISLTHGLDHPDDRPKVDILVPEGLITRTNAPPGEAFDVRIGVRISRRAGSVMSRLIEYLAPPEDRRTGRTGEPTGVAMRPSTSEIHEVGSEPVTREDRGREPIGRLTQSSFQRDAYGAAHGAIDADRGVDFAFAVKAGESERDEEIERLGRVDTRAGRAGDAAWVEIHCDRDLRTIGAGERASVTVLVSLLSGRDAYRGQLRGTFAVSRVGSGNGHRRQLSGMFDGLVGAEKVDIGAVSRRVKAPVSLLVGDDHRGLPSLQIRLPEPRFSKDDIGHAIMEVAWQGQLLSVDVLTTTDVPPERGRVSELRRRESEAEAAIPAEEAAAGREIALESELEPSALETIARGRFRRDADVRNAADPAHVAAISAIHAISIGLHDRAFEEHAREALFPPVPAAPAEVTVRATNDWVLFHRRRDKDCGPVSVEPRPHQQYMLYGVAGGLLTHMPMPIQIGPVEFDAESATLLSSPPSLRSDWEAAAGQVAIVEGRIRPAVGPADAALLLDRLVAVERALDPTVMDRPVPNTVSEDLSILSPEGTDGVILLTAVAPRQQVLLRVAAIELKQVAASDTAGNARGHLAVSDGQIYVNDGLDFNAIDITFEGATLDVSSVVPGKSLIVDDEASTGGTIIDRGPNVVRYYAEGGLGGKDHKLILRGDGDAFIADTDGHRLDGDYAATFPSGNETEGGDFQIGIVIIRIN